MSDSLLRLAEELLRLADRLVDNPIIELSASLYFAYIQRVIQKLGDMADFSRTVLFMLRTMLLYEMMGIGGGGLFCNNCDGATFEHLGSQTKINYFETTIQCPVLRLPTRSK